MKIKPAGDTAVMVTLGSEISPENNALVAGLARLLEQEPIPGVTETVSAYTTLLVVYNPLVIPYDGLVEKLNALESRIGGKGAGGKKRVLVFPVCYGGEYGEDLGFVAEHAGMGTDEVIKRHTTPDYLIYMLGFLPGFVYLGGLDPKIAAPRLTTPRVKIRAGTVGIAGTQTGMYPLDSPGGWRLIGATPVRLYDPAREPAILYQAGDYIRFESVDDAAYRDIAAQVAAGTYRVTVQEVTV
jgi:KipI family sensor histidine kinase inhibitor